VVQNPFTGLYFIVYGFSLLVVTSPYGIEGVSSAEVMTAESRRQACDGVAVVYVRTYQALLYGPGNLAIENSKHLIFINDAASP